MDRVLDVYFLPPLGIARIGGSDNPLESFSWQTDRTIHGAHRTVIRPEVTLAVGADGSLRPYLPKSIQFRDGNRLRPVAPFFELWATMESEADGSQYDCPLTLDLLERLGSSLDSVEYSVTVANRKAQRRAQSAACAFEAHIDVSAADNAPKPLLAYSPHNSGEEPLVSREHPIPLGYFQAIKPLRSVAIGVDLATLRVRFTPARGEVYGPPEAIAGPASPLPPGGALDPKTLGGRLHEIVPEKNRILNSRTPWSTYVMDREDQQDPQPSDSYDGANVGQNRSWGVVDDTCDGIIEAQVVISGQRLTATARVFSGCPDFAPDRRPFFSFADDLADRDLPPVADEALEPEIVDLFVRVFETASMVNLDATRNHGILENSGTTVVNPPGYPQIDDRTMTEADKPYADLTEKDFPYPPTHESVPQDRLPYADVVLQAHAPLADWDSLIDFLASRRDHVERIVRPPFGRVRQLDEALAPQPNSCFRDPRVPRDTLQDMRMPPYMRDSDENPLSITHRQYDALMRLLDKLARTQEQVPAVTGGEAGRMESPVARRVRRLSKRLTEGPKKK